LRRDAALLDWETRDVSCREDIGETVNLPMRVDREQPLDRLRQPVDARSEQSGQRDDAICRNAPVRKEA
jgi:hypothetical protein